MDYGIIYWEVKALGKRDWRRFSLLSIQLWACYVWDTSEPSKWIFQVGNGICVCLKIRAMICVWEIHFGIDDT